MELYSFDSQVFKSLMIPQHLFGLCLQSHLWNGINYVCFSFDFTFLVTSIVFVSFVHLFGFCLQPC